MQAEFSSQWDWLRIVHSICCVSVYAGQASLHLLAEGWVDRVGSQQWKKDG